MVYVPTPLSLLLPRSLLLSHLPQFWPVHTGSAVTGMSLGGRETTMEALCCFQDHRDQESREDGVGLAQLREATQINSTGLTLRKVCSQLPKFPTLGCWDTRINVSYSSGGERNVRFALRQVNSSNQTNRLCPPLQLARHCKDKGLLVGEG